MKLQKLLIEIAFDPYCSIMTEAGKALTGEVLAHALDCTQPGDVEPAVRFLREKYKIEWRIVKQITPGKYQNVIASASDKQKISEAIYFESDEDYTDEETAEIYLIWDACETLKLELENEE